MTEECDSYDCDCNCEPPIDEYKDVTVGEKTVRYWWTPWRQSWCALERMRGFPLEIMQVDEKTASPGDVRS